MTKVAVTISLQAGLHLYFQTRCKCARKGEGHGEDHPECNHIAHVGKKQGMRPSHQGFMKGRVLLDQPDHLL